MHLTLICIGLFLFAAAISAQAANPRSVIPKPTSRPTHELQPNGTLLLVGGNWKVQSASLVLSSPKQIARAEFDDRQWVPATVPGTVLSSYLDAGKIPDPYYADQRYQIDDAFFTDNDFWYRDTFAVPKEFTGHRIWLNFDGINWKADIFVNGSRVGRIDGAFLRGRFDVTPLVKPGEKMCLAVLVHKVAHPGEVKHKSLAKWPPNGGILGLDSPTFVSSIGWNWLPTIPGRNVGIWNDVWLSSSGDVSIVDPFVTTELPSPDVAEITARVELVNHSNQPQDGTVHGAIDNIEFSSPISLAASETKTITFDKTNCPQLVIRNPKLWWPNGMGDQPIYHLKLRVDLANVTSDAKEIPFGIRKLTYQTHDNVLFIYCNGQRVLLRGGNWGMDEGMLRCDDAGYELRVRLHKEMNFTMIRNWVGMTGRDGFYNACDKYGILIWDDFWLANPADGPDPSDEAMFMTNARDKIRRVRNHPSLALYCGRNEGYPPKSLDEQLHAATKELDPTRKYLSHSAADGATGFGPYDVHAPEWYFEHRGMTLHSELGIVAVPPVETLRTFLPPDKLWPINDLWGQHDLSQERGPAYIKRLTDSYGEASSVEDFCRKAQLLNLESAKAMLECWQSHQGSGGLIWMTQSAWPCLICQAYTYELEPTGAYFGFKKACEPVHILRDSYTNRIKAANDTPHDLNNLTAEASVYDLNGARRWTKSKAMSLASTSAVDCFTLDVPENVSEVYFVKLTLKRGDELLSDNFYWASTNDHHYQSLQSLPKVGVRGEASLSRTTSKLTAYLTNPTSTVLVALRLKLVHAATGERVLPAFYQDNYFAMLPGEDKTISIAFDSTDDVKLLTEGWNVEPGEIPIEVPRAR